MSSYTKAPDDVMELAEKVLKKHETHKPLLDAKVRIDYLMAWPAENEAGDPTGPAITCRGWPATAMCRKLGVKDRVKGMGDAEIIIDGEWWENEVNTEAQRMALLDHELHHLEVVKDDDDEVQKDDAGRPKLRIRKHDVQVGWFKIVAERNKADSQEQIQAKSLLDNYGQAFWPSIIPLQDQKKKAA